MLDQLLQLDKELFIFLNGLGKPSWDGFWMFYTTKFYWIPLYALLLYLIFRNLSLKMFLVSLVLAALLITFTDQITNMFKHGIMRPRPCHENDLQSIMRLVKPYCGGKYGYFSGHASNSMAIAVFIGFLLRKKYKYLLGLMVFWAVLMAYSRIYIGVHYPLDVLSGMLFGALSGFLFFKLSQFIKTKYSL